MYLSDREAVEILVRASSYLNRAQSKNGVWKSGLIFVKENIIIEPRYFLHDADEHSIMRSVDHYL